MVYPPPPGYYGFDQTYFVFEPQVNVTVRVAPALALVGGVGYRVIGWANGWEDRIQGFTGTVRHPIRRRQVRPPSVIAGWPCPPARASALP